MAEPYTDAAGSAAVHAFEATEMIALGLIVLAAHIGGKICRRYHISEVTGQLVGGALVGPVLFGLFDVLPQYNNAVGAFHFFIFLFLSLVAFGIGEELHLSRLAKIGRKALIISLVHALITCALITLAFRYIGTLIDPQMTWLKAILIGSTGVASAPAVTFVLMDQLRIEGRLRHMMGSVVVLVDLVEVLLFSFVVQLLLKGNGRESGGSSLGPVFMEVASAALIGVAIYLILRLLVRRRAGSLESVEDEETREPAPDAAFLQRILAEHPSPSAEIFLIILGAIGVGAGVAYLHEWPFLITAIVAGFLVANFHSHALFDSLKIDNITPVLNLFFFALMGANLSFGELGGSTLALAGLYVITRFAGKVAGTWIGCRLAGEEIKISRCLPFLLLPQAGVSAVEAVFATAVLGDPLYASVILPAIVFFQLVGVHLADRTLRRWRTWVADEEAALRSPAPGGTGGRGEAARRLLGLLAPERIVLGLTGATKSRVIEELVEVAIRTGPDHVDRAQALQLLGEREKLAPTGFGHGIALPHCRLMGLGHPLVVFGRHPEGIVFGGVDEEPCDLVLLILSPARDPGIHLKLLAATAHVLGDAETRAAVREAKTPEALLALLQRIAAPGG